MTKFIKSVSLYHRQENNIQISQRLGKEEVVIHTPIQKAAGCDEKQLFNFHENPNSKCPVGGHIHNALDFRLELLTQTLEDKLKTMKLSDVMKDLEK